MNRLATLLLALGMLGSGVEVTWSSTNRLENRKESGFSDRQQGTVGEAPTLTDKLEESGGVIRPPANIDPEIRVPAPVPNPGTTPVIPPSALPGTPDGDYRSGR